MRSRRLFDLLKVSLFFKRDDEDLRVAKEIGNLRFTCHHAECLYTIYRYRFSGDIFAKIGQVFDSVQKVVPFTLQKRGMDVFRSFAKKETTGKKYKKQLFSCFRKIKTTQTFGSLLAERIQQVKEN